MIARDLNPVCADNLTNTPAAPLLETVKHPFNDEHNRRVLSFCTLQFSLASSATPANAVSSANTTNSPVNVPPVNFSPTTHVFLGPTEDRM